MKLDDNILAFLCTCCCVLVMPCRLWQIICYPVLVALVLWSWLDIQS